jgi:hypothetical protein
MVSNCAQEIDPRINAPHKESRYEVNSRPKFVFMPFIARQCHSSSRCTHHASVVVRRRVAAQGHLRGSHHHCLRHSIPIRLHQSCFFHLDRRLDRRLLAAVLTSSMLQEQDIELAMLQEEYSSRSHPLGSRLRQQRLVEVSAYCACFASVAHSRDVAARWLLHRVEA